MASCLQSGYRGEKPVLIPSYFSISVQSWVRVHRLVCVSTVKPLWKHPHEHAHIDMQNRDTEFCLLGYSKPINFKLMMKIKHTAWGVITNTPRIYLCWGISAILVVAPFSLFVLFFLFFLPKTMDKSLWRTKCLLFPGIKWVWTLQQSRRPHPPTCFPWITELVSASPHSSPLKLTTLVTESSGGL